MAFTMKEEEFFEKYLAKVVKEDKMEEAKELSGKIFASVNTKDFSSKVVIATMLPSLLSMIKPEFKDETKKTLVQWFEKN
ncbi:hypothetical protein [Enterococcus timonensis]|uniref:hypothetical protein n=1 Tax=Enterococcus timonensis TaxID=1852364 RepID=UPI0008D90F8A|nr:hypothetical protein [Enterococcus timonensis]